MKHKIWHISTSHLNINSTLLQPTLPDISSTSEFLRWPKLQMKRKILHISTSQRHWMGYSRFSGERLWLCCFRPAEWNSFSSECMTMLFRQAEWDSVSLLNACDHVFLDQQNGIPFIWWMICGYIALDLQNGIEFLSEWLCYVRPAEWVNVCHTAHI
jgi:hypothetical protein